MTVCIFAYVAGRLHSGNRAKIGYERRIAANNAVLLDELMLAYDEEYDENEISVCCYLDTGGGGLALSPVPFQRRNEVSINRFVLAKLSNECAERLARRGLALSSFLDRVVLVKGVYFESGYQGPGRLLAGNSYVLVKSIGDICSCDVSGQQNPSIQGPSGLGRMPAYGKSH